MTTQNFSFPVFLTALLLSASVTAAPRFDHYVLKGEGQFKELISRDLDADGRADLLATHAAGSYPRYRRSLYLFFQRPDGSFAATADQVIALDKDAALVDVGDVLPDPGLEILLLGPEGVAALTLAERRYSEPKPLVRRSSFAAAADPLAVPVYDFARDWDGDGQDEILVPGFKSFALFQTPEGPAQELRIGARPGILPTYRPGTAIEAKFTLWDVQPGDFDGDGKADIIAFQNDSILVFKQVEAGRFSGSADPRIELNLWDERARQEREIRPLTQALAPDYYLLADDFNADGKADFLTLTLTGGFIGLVSDTRLYFGGDPRLLQGKPSQSIVLKDAGAGPWLADLEGDGKKELLLTYAAMSVGNAAKAVLSGKADAVSECYRLGPDGRFAEKAVWVYKSSVKMDLKTVTLEGTLPVFQGDFNGDGAVDVFQGVSREESAIVLSQSGRYDHPPAAIIPCPVSLQVVGNPRLQDLDGDKKADLAVVFPRERIHGNEIHVFMNRGGW